MKLIFILQFLITMLLGTSCAIRPSEGSSPTTPAFPSPVTITPVSTSAPSETPLPPPPQPTIVPVQGLASTQINVRAEPSTAGNILGILPANTKVDIVGKDPGGNWWQILYPQGVDGKGWVTAQYVTTAAGVQIPVVGGNAADPNSENAAIIQQQINVRSGPGTGFNSLGTLNPQDVVTLTGKDSNGAWLQILFPAGPDGKGWLNGAFVQAKSVENLPIITQAGEVIGTGTPTGVPVTSTPTILPAWSDNDSRENPIASVVFEPLGVRTLIYSGDLSSPDGDTQDWIRFTSFGTDVFAALECGGRTLQVSLLENGQPSEIALSCGEPVKELKVIAGSTYLIQLQPLQSSGSLQYIPYIITIQTSP